MNGFNLETAKVYVKVDDTTIRGYLQKLSHRWKVWNRRWYVNGQLIMHCYHIIFYRIMHIHVDFKFACLNSGSSLTGVPELLSTISKC